MNISVCAKRLARAWSALDRVSVECLADSEETQPHKQGPLTGRRERSARAQEAGGSEGPLPAEQEPRLRTRRLPVSPRILPTARTVAVGLFGLRGFSEQGRNLAGNGNGRDNFHLDTVDSTHQAGQVTSKEWNTGGAVDSEETQPHKNGPLTGRRERSARAQEAGGSEGPLPAEQVGRAGEAPPGRTPAVGARRASAAGSEDLPAAEVKLPKPPQRTAVGGTRRDRCSGPPRG